ncbi:MAG: endonuclease/exonuclease/phosphatase family protein [Bacteroidia bacterium]|nr:endonuclease/exonuclease/phosphatase family protein [Bacteroidia bacterium]
MNSYLFATAYPVHPLRVMSFNLRLHVASDGYNAWPLRQDLVESMIRFHGTDLLGVQEVLPAMMDDMHRMLPDYEYWGMPRDTGAWGEYSALFYKRSRLERLDGGTFWLSETPDTRSRGWDAALNRIATWALFRDRVAGDTFFCLNTHFDHRGETARQESARLLLTRVRDLNPRGLPVILMGDLNSQPDSKSYQILTDTGNPLHLHDAYYAPLLPHHGPASTWSGFAFPGEPGRRIDYIMYRGPVTILRHGALSESWSGRFPSDHLPVVAEVVFNPVLPHPQAHAHNDYEHPHPLTDALTAGFSSVEADVWLLEDQLYVSHDRPRQLTPARTLARLYLEPLAARISAYGYVHPAHPGTFRLMIDIKHEGEATWAALQAALAPYAWMLEPGADGAPPLMIFLSGDRPESLRRDPASLPIGLDGRPEDLGTGIPASRMPVISQRYGALLSWNGQGEIPAKDRQTLDQLVAAAHAEGKQVRLWASPEKESIWNWLLDSGVDLINTDALARLQALLDARRAAETKK